MSGALRKALGARGLRALNGLTGDLHRPHIGPPRSADLQPQRPPQRTVRTSSPKPAGHRRGELPRRDDRKRQAEAHRCRAPSAEAHRRRQRRQAHRHHPLHSGRWAPDATRGPNQRSHENPFAAHGGCAQNPRLGVALDRPVAVPIAVGTSAHRRPHIALLVGRQSGRACPNCTARGDVAGSEAEMLGGKPGKKIITGQVRLACVGPREGLLTRPADKPKSRSGSGIWRSSGGGGI